MSVTRLPVSLFLAAVLAVVVAVPARAQVQAGQQAQCVEGCGGGGGSFTITPDGEPVTVPGNSAGRQAVFDVWNATTTFKSVSFSCASTGPVTCTGVNPSSYVFDANEATFVRVTYSTSGAGSGTVTLIGSGDVSEQGSYAVTVTAPAAPSVALRNHNGDNIDRGLCLTTGAGEAAGVSCGDLFVTHGMPAYRTLGRDRSLSLYYNSATSSGLVLVAADVTQPAGSAVPNSVKVVLTVGTAKDSALYSPIAAGQRKQIVVGRGITGLATGVYPMTLLVRNVYSGSSLDATVSGTVLVVNRSASEYGRGWSLLGVEQVLMDPADSTRRVWLSGDGSIRLYQRGTPLTSGMLSQAGLSAFNPTAIVDSNTGTQGWHTSTASAGAWLKTDLGTARTVTTLRVYAAAQSNAIWDIQYSDNGTSWGTAFAGYKPGSGWTQANWRSAGAHRYWRLYLTNTPGSGPWMNELSFGNPLNFYGAPGDAPDSLVRFDTLGTKWYRRDLKHRAAVVLDAAGRHQFTRNRVGARTVFTWGTIAGQTRLQTITVPPNDATARNYNLHWNGSTAQLDSIKDPGGRRLKTSQSSGLLVAITDPDSQVTRFKYAGNLLTQRVYPRKGMKGDSAYTAFTYADGARLTTVAVQTDSAGTQFLTTVLTPWDGKGLALPYGSTSTAVATTTGGLPTRLDGPLTGTGDAADFWVNRFGQPDRTVAVGLNTVTQYFREASSLPGLVTKVIFPHPSIPGAAGRIVTLAYDGRGNLLQQRDSTSHLGVIGLPTKVVGYTYGDASNPDSPTQSQDALERASYYAYTSLGLTDSVIDARGHATKFFYRASGPLRGMVDSVAERRVSTWIQSTTSESVLDQTTRFTHDANGSVLTTKGANGAITSYVPDAMGRILDLYDPLGTRTSYTWDTMNRVKVQTLYTSKQAHPGGINPVAAVPITQFDTTDATRPFTPAMPATLLTKYALTPSGQLDSVLDPANVKRKFGYDAMGRVVREIDDSNRVKRYFYGNQGLLDSVLMRHGSMIKYQYDSFGRRTRIISPDRVLSGWGPTVTVPADTIAYTYDLLGNQLTATGRVITDSMNAPATITRAYYADGSLRARSSRLPTPRTPGQNDSLTYEYDATGARTKVRMFALGGPPAWTDSVSYGYDSHGDLSTMQVCFGAVGSSYAGGCKFFGFSHDGLGRRRVVTYPTNGMTVTYYYDAGGTLRRVASNNTSGFTGNRFRFDYTAEVVDPIGRIRRQRVECHSPPTLPSTETLEFPCRDGSRPTWQVDSTQYNRRSEVVLRLDDRGNYDSLWYDVSGGMSLRHQYKVSDLEHTVDSFFVSTGSNRLNRNRRTTPKSFTLSYKYDEDGARLAQVVSPQQFGTIENEHYWYYDGLGRQRGYRYMYWKNGEPKGVNHPLDCGYDPDGNAYMPCQYDAPGQSYDGANIIRVGNLWRFVHGPGVDNPLIGRLVSGTETGELYFVTDGQGRQLAVGQPDGSLPSDVWTQPDHADRRWVGTVKGGFGFNQDRTGNAELPGVALFRNRSYDSRSGRWLQEDPIGIAGGLNLYQFNGNNPVAFTDPFGLCPPQWLCDLIGATAGQEATEHWASVASSSSGATKAGATALGLLSALWTPDTYLETSATLLTAAGLNATLVEGAAATQSDGEAEPACACAREAPPDRRKPHRSEPSPSKRERHEDTRNPSKDKKRRHDTWVENPNKRKP